MIFAELLWLIYELFFNPSEEAGGLNAFIVVVFMFGTLIAWPVILLINRRTDRKRAQNPTSAVTPEQLQKFRRQRLIVITIVLLIWAGGTALSAMS